jgi:hypothetical protein
MSKFFKKVWQAISSFFVNVWKSIAKFFVNCWKAITKRKENKLIEIEPEEIDESELNCNAVYGRSNYRSEERKFDDLILATESSHCIIINNKRKSKLKNYDSFEIITVGESVPTMYDIGDTVLIKSDCDTLKEIMTGIYRIGYGQVSFMKKAEK